MCLFFHFRYRQKLLSCLQVCDKNWELLEKATIYLTLCISLIYKDDTLTIMILCLFPPVLLCITIFQNKWTKFWVSSQLKVYKKLHITYKWQQYISLVQTNIFNLEHQQEKKWYWICKYSSHKDERFPKEGFLNRWHMREGFSSCNWLKVAVLEKR